MAPLLKNAEVAGSMPPQPATPLRADHLSADAVSLDVPVKVHGSRVTEIVRGTTPHTEPFEEQASTMIVFPQGGVLRMSTPVNVGQMLVLTNLKSNQDAICRVIKVRTYSNLAGYVEVEFTHSHPGYWGVDFAADSLSLLKTPTAEESAINEPSAKAADPSGSPNSSKPSTPSSSVQPNRQETSFISIGSKEEVQPSASVTRVAKLSVVRKETQIPVQERTGAPEINPARVPQSRIPTPATGNTVSVSENTEEIESSPAANPQLAENLNSVTPDAVASSKPSFGAGLVSGTQPYTEDEKKPSFNWNIIAAGAALAIALGGGGFFLMHSGTSKNAATISTPVSAPAAQVDSIASSAANAQAQTPAPQLAASTPPATRASQQRSEAPAKTADSRPTKASVPSDDVRNTQSQSTKSETTGRPEAKYIPDVTSDLFGTLNAHPMAGSHNAAAQAYAPAPEGATAASNEASALPGVSSSIALAAPPVDPSQPIQVKKMVVQPRLLSSVLPVYPAAASTVHAQGDVVVQATIDENGNVANTKVLSGPILLRQAAIDALHKWKYDPSKVNGKPVAAQIVVTLRFRL